MFLPKDRPPASPLKPRKAAVHRVCFLRVTSPARGLTDVLSLPRPAAPGRDALLKGTSLSAHLSRARDALWKTCLDSPWEPPTMAGGHGCHPGKGFPQSFKGQLHSVHSCPAFRLRWACGIMTLETEAEHSGSGRTGDTGRAAAAVSMDG